MQYFDLIVGKLTIDDISILGILQTKDAVTTFKAMRKQLLLEESGMSKAIFRMSICRLIGNCFIETVTGKKEHLLFITEYGTIALQQSMEGVLS